MAPPLNGALRTAGCAFLADALAEPLGGGLPAVHRAEGAPEALHAALGAAFCGARAAAVLPAEALPASAGALALAEEAEIPLVALLVGEAPPGLRLEPGPACPALVLEEGASLRRAFALAEAWQCPVLVRGAERCAPEEGPVPSVGGRWARTREGFDRYAEGPEGVSPRAVPGMEGFVFSAPDPGTDEARRTRLLDKRRRKMEAARRCAASGAPTPAAPLPPPPPSPRAMIEAEPLPAERFLRGDPDPVALLIARALARSGLRPEDVLLCAASSFLPGLRVSRLHAPAAPLAAAAGAARANPGLRVLAAGSARGEDLRALVDCAREGAEVLFLTRTPPLALEGLRAAVLDLAASQAEDVLFEALSRRGLRTLELRG